MKLIDKIKSETDNVTKYVFRLYENDNDIAEFSYIDNGTGKDIICISTQTMCEMRCKFCHCTDHIMKIKVRQVSSWHILRGIDEIVRDIPKRQSTLLISFMGCGEPFNTNYGSDLITSMHEILNLYKDRAYIHVRFAVATMLPKTKTSRFFQFCDEVRKHKLPVKLHLSLHYTDDEIRRQWMPNALDITSSIAACKFYKEYTGNAVEVHYTLIDGVNDKIMDLSYLNRLLENTGFNLKFIVYNEKETLDNKASRKIHLFNKFVTSVPTEIYLPPGRDIGSSCGQFSFEQYEKYKIKKD